MVKAFETDEPYEATKKAVDATNVGRTDKAAAVLTPEQTAKAKELVGAPYTGNYTTNPFGPPGSGGLGDTFPDLGGGRTSPAAGNRQEAAFGRYAGDFLHVARNPDVQ